MHRRLIYHPYFSATNMRQYEVIIPVRNGGLALVNSIQSVLSCPNAGRLLLTVSDNFSTDGAPWKRLLENFPRQAWRVLSPPQSLGRVEHWTWAFAQAQLPWVKPLMVGDLIENTYWDWASAAIEKNPQAGLLFSGSRTIDPARAHPHDGAVASTSQANTSIYTNDDFIRDAVACCNRIGALSSLLVRADLMRQALPFEPEFSWTADWRFCKRVLQRAPALQTTALLVALDRSIPRLSTSWKGLRNSFGEEWRFAAEQAASVHASRAKAFAIRCRVIGVKMIFVMGKKLLPRSVRGFLTSATGLHRSST